MANRSVVIQGPKASGKTRNAPRLLRAFGLNQVIELDDLILINGWRRRLRSTGHLYLTSSDQLAAEVMKLTDARVVRIADALRGMPEVRS